MKVWPMHEIRPDQGSGVSSPCEKCASIHGGVVREAKETEDSFVSSSEEDVQPVLDKNKQQHCRYTTKQGTGRRFGGSKVDDTGGPHSCVLS